jgi:Raf kinase inhibitor-like YbhB/YbcL family protein
MMPVAMETITVKSSSFHEGEAIDKKYSTEGRNVSPALEWSGVPDEAGELVLMMEDPDGSAGNFSHWLVYNIPPTVIQFPEGIEPTLRPGKIAGIHQGKNSFVKLGYGGPLPASGSGVHHYYFHLFALDQKLNLEPGLYKEDVQKAMSGHVIARGVIMGTYER